MALTDDAKRELADAIRIVREDKFEQFVRTRLSRPEAEPTKDGPEPPPLKDPDETTTSPDDKPRSSYWGQLLDD